MSSTSLQLLSARGEDQAIQGCLAIAKGLPVSLRPLTRFIAYSPISWEWKHYWLENANLWHRQSLLTKQIKSRGKWSKVEDEVFEGWNKSEYAEMFMHKMAKRNDLKASSEYCLNKLSIQLLSLANKHFHYTDKRAPYTPQFELGDFPTPSVSLPLKLDEDVTVEFLTWDCKIADKQLAKILSALSLIKTYSPTSFHRFKLFTKRIVPIKQKELVSYSLQSLPGHSFINLYHRDEIDLLDDLLHENGHHHLNMHLILGNLLREDPDQIYYSPWRRTLRPIRGIYHAHFTFFYALKLFYDLSLSLLNNELVWPKPLTTNQKDKILFRFMEEWTMLDYTGEDLARARRRGQITSEGWKVVQLVEKERKEMKHLIKKILPKLSQDSSESLEALKVILSTQAKLTRAVR